MFTTTYSLRTEADGTVSVLDADGNPVGSAVSIERAADLVRRLENGAHFGDLLWQTVTADQMPEVLAALGHDWQWECGVDGCTQGCTSVSDSGAVRLASQHSTVTDILSDGVEFNVESVDVSELREGDFIVHQGSGWTSLVLVAARPNATVHAGGRVGTYRVLFGGTYLTVNPGTHYQRATDRQAVQAAQTAATKARRDTVERQYRTSADAAAPYADVTVPAALVDHLSETTDEEVLAALQAGITLPGGGTRLSAPVASHRLILEACWVLSGGEGCEATRRERAAYSRYRKALGV